MNQGNRFNLGRKAVSLAVISALQSIVLANSAQAACVGSAASPQNTNITVECSGTGTTGNVSNNNATTYVDTSTVTALTSSATNFSNTLLQFDGQGRTLDNTGTISNNRVINASTTTARNRVAVLMGAATINAGTGTTFTGSNAANSPTAGAATIKLNAAPAVGVNLVGQTIVIGRYNAAEGDFANGEQRLITAYDATTRVATLASPLTASFAGTGATSDPIGYKVISNFGGGDNVINNAGTISSQILSAEINANKTGTSPNFSSAAYTSQSKAISAAVEGNYIINNSATGVISAKHDGIGATYAIEEGGAVTEMTINNAGLISATRTAALTLVDNTATGNPTATSTNFTGFLKQTLAQVNAINTQEEADVLTLNNAATGTVRATGDYAGAIYMRAAEKNLNNDGLIEYVGNKGYAIGAVSDGGKIRTLDLENNTTGVIKGDILVTNGNSLRYYLLTKEGGAAGLDSRLLINNQVGQSDSEINNSGKITGNFYYSNGTQSLSNAESGVIVGNIDLDQRNTTYSTTATDTVATGTVVTLDGLNTKTKTTTGYDFNIVGTKQFTFENTGSFTGNINIRDVATSINSITLSGTGFNGAISAINGVGNNTINLADDGTLGNVTKFSTLNAGGDDWTLSAGKTAEFTNANITAGIFSVLGNLKANTVVGNGATLQGTGTVTGNLSNNGTIELADTTLNVVGNLTANAGSTINTTITPTSVGLLSVTGNAVVNGKIVPTLDGLTVANGDHFSVINAASVSGTPTVQSSSALLHWLVSTTATEVVLTVDAQASNIAGVSASAGSAINALTGFSNSLGSALLGLNSAADVAKAGEQLRPEINGANYSAMQSASLQLQNTVNVHIGNTRKASNGQSGVATGEASLSKALWFQGFGYTGEQQKRKGVDGYNADGGGFALGADTLLQDDVRLGAAISYANTTVDASGVNQGNHSKIDSYQAMIYSAIDGKLANSAWYLNANVALAQHQVDTKRLINIGGVIDTPKGNFEAWQYSAKVEGGLPYTISNITTLIPIASLSYSHLNQDGYTETSNGGGALKISGNNTDSVRTGLGGKAVFNLGAKSINSQLESHAMWFHELADTEQDTTARFNAGGAAFTTNGVKMDRNAYNLGASLNLSNKAATQTLSISYDAEIKDQYLSHSGKLQARFNF